ncbi:MAG: nucleotidyltransferase family protein [Cyanobium sp. M30B3]|jgi:hypothetical protein|nr:MAG: nucleotidyltransferase family protein [Cyanobium sp. M30B3]
MSTARAAVPLAASRWVATAVSRVLQQRHPGSALAPLTLPPPSAASTDDLIEAIARHRVIPLLTPWADPLGLPPDAVAKLQALRRQEHLLGLANIVGTVTAAQALSVAGVDHLVVKGVCLPALSHRQPATRGRGDVDVWVRASDLGAAESALARAGWRRSEQHRTLPQQGDGWRWGILVRFSYELTLTHPRHSDVDLHWRLGHVGREFSFSFEQALSQSVALPAVGQGVRTLAPLQALEHLAQHGRKEAWPTLRHLVDIIELSECCGLQRVRDLACRQSNLRLALATAAHLSPDLIDGVPIDRRSTRLAAEAWAGCLSLTKVHADRLRLKGAAAVISRASMAWWLMRSAPSWPVRLNHFLWLVGPIGAVVRRR